MCDPSYPLQVDEVAQGASIAQPRAVDFTANETWSRLNADPMLMMKKRQLDKQKEIQEKIKMIRLQVNIASSFLLSAALNFLLPLSAVVKRDERECQGLKQFKVIAT